MRAWRLRNNPSVEVPRAIGPVRSTSLNSPSQSTKANRPETAGRKAKGLIFGYRVSGIGCRVEAQSSPHTRYPDHETRTKAAGYRNAAITEDRIMYASLCRRLPAVAAGIVAALLWANTGVFCLTLPSQKSVKSRAASAPIAIPAKCQAQESDRSSQ